MKLRGLTPAVSSSTGDPAESALSCLPPSSRHVGTSAGPQSRIHPRILRPRFFAEADKVKTSMIISIQK